MRPKIDNLGDGWYEITTGIPVVNISPEEAKERAVQRALQLAIEQFSGIEVSGRTTSIEAESNDNVSIAHFSKLTQQVSNGIVLEKEILEEKNFVFDDGIIIKSVTSKIKVGNQKGKKDPSFQITATLNREYYKNGEELEIELKSSKDCYITILNICSNDSVYVLFPNNYRENNFLKSGEIFKLPNSDDKKIGLYFPVNLLPNKDKDFEMIKVIATKEKTDFSSVYLLSAYGTYQTALIDLQNWLLKIPRNEIEEVDLQYFVGK